MNCDNDRQGREPLGDKDDTISKMIVVKSTKYVYVVASSNLKYVLYVVSGQKRLTQQPIFFEILIGYHFSGIVSLSK